MKKFLAVLILMLACLMQGASAQAPRVNISNLGTEFYATAYGVKCDGSTDDTAALQRTIDAAFAYGKAGTVVLPAGTCRTKTLTFGPVTDPFETGGNSALNFTGVGFAFNPPREATVTFTAGSSAISWTADTITSDDVGNYVFYGPLDAVYDVLGESRVLKPTYGCTITAVLTSTTGICVATTYKWQVGPTLSTTSGAQSVYITDDHNFEIDNTVFNSTTAALDPDHVGKSIQFALPIVRSYLKFDNTDRDGSHVVFEPTPAPCTGTPTADDWQCMQDQNIKSKYFSAVITEVTDATHGKMEISGLRAGSNWVDLFPDYPSHGAAGGVCGGPEVNCASFPAHQWGHLVAPESLLIGLNPHIDHYLTPELMSDINEFQNKHTYVGNIYPYALPASTEQRYMSIRGASQAATVLSFTGCPEGSQYATACPALIFSKNKYFKAQDFTVTNASGSDADDLTQWGIYMGGLPGIGTQALQFTFDRVGVSGFGVCVQLGDDLGGEMSDAVFNQLAIGNCGIGVRIGPGSYNTLDLTFNEFAGGFNKIGMLNYEGNVVVNWGSMSYNDIDFWSTGFGPMRIENMRTEGPGLPFLGGESGFAIRSTNLAEPNGARQISGDVVSIPADTRDIASVVVSNVSVGLPAGSFFPITFGSGDITAADLRKTFFLPGLGSGGADVVGQIWEIDSVTTGKIYAQNSGGVVTAGTVTLTIYDSDLANITFPTDELTPGDLGASLALADASPLLTWNRATRCVITEILSSTTGKCGFYRGNQGAGPLAPAGGTDTDPTLFVNIAFYANNAAESITLENNLWSTGRAINVTDETGNVSYHITNNQLLSVGQWPLTLVGSTKAWRLDLDHNDPDLSTLPTPSSNLTNGVLLPWVYLDSTNQGNRSSVMQFSQGNLSKLYGGPTPWPLMDGVYSGPINTVEPLQTIFRPLTDFELFNPFNRWRQPGTAPTAPSQQFNRVKELSESGYANGKNLRVFCTFATSATSTCTFARSEAYEIRLGISSPTTFAPETNTYSVNVTSGHFSQADVGKEIVIPNCCNDDQLFNFYGYITEIVSATQIKIRGVPSSIGTSFTGAMPFTGNATVGVAEPDDKWIPVLWGCNANETFWIDSHSASQVVIKSSNATSTAGCVVGVIR